MATYNSTGSNETFGGSTGADDYYFTTGWGQDTITTGSNTGGWDQLYITNSTALTLNLAVSGGSEVTDGTNTINWDSSTVFDDILISNSANNVVYFAVTADNSGTNTGAGNDTFVFGDGQTHTTLLDSGGTDTVILNTSRDLWINLTPDGGGNPEIWENSWASDKIFINWYSNAIENVVSGSGNDLITGSTSANSINAGNGNDTIDAGSGNDTLEGNQGDDSLDGGGGNDTYIFKQYIDDQDEITYYDGFDFDTITDTVGIDTLDFSNIIAIDSQSYQIYAVNYIYLEDGLADMYVLEGYADYGDDPYLEVHNVTFGNSGNILSVVGSQGDDSVVGFDYNETLDGYTGNDTIDAAYGTDMVYGGGGNDSLRGGYENDTLNGGTGDDTLKGENDNDEYYYANEVWGADSIVDTGTTDDYLNFVARSTAITVNLASGAGHEVTDGTSTINWSSNEIWGVFGSSAADVISGNTNANFISGYVGNDTLAGGSGNDEYYYGSEAWGTDSITDSGTSDDYVNFTYRSTGVTINLISSGGNEVTDGTNTVNWSSDVIYGAFGSAAADVIYGNNSANYLSGGAGNDTITGGGGYSDSLNGDDGNDSLTLGSEGGTANGGNNDDILIGGSGSNSLNGDAGNDSITGGSSIDYITGGSGNDTMDGGASTNYYSFTATGWGADSISGDSGTGWLDFSYLSTSITVNLTSSVGHEVTDGTSTVNWASNVIENVVGTTASDYLIGNSSDNYFDARDGNNTIIAGSGNDYLTAYAGTSDSLDGGDGNDTYELNNNGNDIIADSSGTDTLYFSTGSVITINLTSGAGAEVTDGTNTLNWSGDAIENFVCDDGQYLITGNSANNYIQTVYNNDTVNAGAGNDTIETYDGNDSITGGSGDDSITDYDGNETYVFASGFGADFIQDDAGTDNLIFGGSITNALTINLNTGGSGTEVTDGTNSVDWDAGTDFEYVTSGWGNDVITGNVLNNIIWGSNGNDTTDGGLGNDNYKYSTLWGYDSIIDAGGTDTLTFTGVTHALTINLTADNTAGVHEVIGGGTVNWSTSVTIEKVVGGNSHDSITGNNSANVIDGGTGNDTMDGGIGNDSYVFSGTWGADSIIDATGVMDAVTLSAITSALTINLNSGAGHEVSNGTSTINWASDAIEQVTGGTAGDVISGNSSVNRINGGNGNDTIDGGSGNDTYVFTGNWGNDSIIDTSGSLDSLDLSGITSNLTIELNPSDVSGNHEVTDGTNTINWDENFWWIEKVITGSGNDVVGCGDDTDCYVDTGGGNDSIYESNGADTLLGNSGNDFYRIYKPVYAQGNDIIKDTSGTDTVQFFNTNTSEVVSWNAIDVSSDADSYIDSLEITLGFGKVITIRDYFDNTQSSATQAALTGHSGSGLIESLQFSNDSDHTFAEVLTHLPP